MASEGPGLDATGLPPPPHPAPLDAVAHVHPPPQAHAYAAHPSPPRADHDHGRNHGHDHDHDPHAGSAAAFSASHAPAPFQPRPPSHPHPPLNHNGSGGHDGVHGGLMPRSGAAASSESSTPADGTSAGTGTGTGTGTGGGTGGGGGGAHGRHSPYGMPMSPPVPSVGMPALDHMIPTAAAAAVAPLVIDGYQPVMLRALCQHTAYDVMPDSQKLIIFDSHLLVKKSLAALLQHRLQAAPIFHTASGVFVGMLTVTDFIHLIIYYSSQIVDRMDPEGQPLAPVPPPTAEELERLTLETLRDIEARMGVLQSQTYTISPADSLHTAVRLLLDCRLHRLPIVARGLPQPPLPPDAPHYAPSPAAVPMPPTHPGMPPPSLEPTAVISIVSQYRILKFLATHYLDHPHLDIPLGQLDLGTFADRHGPLISTTLDAPLIHVLHQFIAHGISAVPVIDHHGNVIDVYEKYDVLMLAREGAYYDLEMPIQEALSKRSPVFEGVHTCTREDSLRSLMVALRQHPVHRFVVLDHRIAPPPSSATAATATTTDQNSAGHASTGDTSAAAPPGDAVDAVDAVDADADALLDQRLIGLVSLSDVLRYVSTWPPPPLVPLEMQKMAPFRSATTALSPLTLPVTPAHGEPSAAAAAAAAADGSDPGLVSAALLTALAERQASAESAPTALGAMDIVPPGSPTVAWPRAADPAGSAALTATGPAEDASDLKPLSGAFPPAALSTASAMPRSVDLLMNDRSLAVAGDPLSAATRSDASALSDMALTGASMDSAASAGLR